MARPCLLAWRKQFDVLICTLVSHGALSCWSLHNNQARGIQFAFHFGRMTNNPIFKERRKFFLLHILLGAVPIDTLFLSSIIKFESLCIFISRGELLGVQDLNFEKNTFRDLLFPLIWADVFISFELLKSKSWLPELQPYKYFKVFYTNRSTKLYHKSTLTKVGALVDDDCILHSSGPVLLMLGTINFAGIARYRDPVAPEEFSLL